ncbi:drug:proton antiporter [Mesorhizobium loti]|nr:VOC family protein [Mesorhizobium loti]PLP56423.1 drug:proton antiporter [Mesorhizobium loti]
MQSPNFVILYAEQPQVSGTFYRALFDREPVESSPTFVLFVLDNGFKLGLWSRHTALPAVESTGGGSEIVFQLETPEAVDAKHVDWASRGLSILQTPTDLDFGRTFVALDPDNHRLRVYWLNDAAQS